MKAKKTGRPLKFADRERLVAQFTSYFDSCTITRQMPNKAALCIWLGISRDTYNEYKKKSGFSDAIKGCEDMIENAWVQRLAGSNATGAIFYLKAAMGWQDKQEVELTGKDGGPIRITGVDIKVRR